MQRVLSARWSPMEWSLVWHGTTTENPDGPTGLSPAERGCAHHEPLLDCAPCGACCREAFDSVPVEDHDERTLSQRSEWVRVHEDGWRDLLRVPSPTGCGTRCAALVGDGATPYRCTIYLDRPTACSELDPGSETCLFARRRVGLTVDPRPPHGSGAA